jgi:hypothetical protein
MLITRNVEEGWTKVDQKRYCQEVLQRFGMDGCKPVSTPMAVKEKLSSDPNEMGDLAPEGTPYRELVGCLNYAATCTRPDIAYAVSMCARYVECPREKHVIVIKRILRYIAGTLEVGVKYSRDTTRKELEIKFYTDADWGGCEDTSRSTTGLIAMMSNGAVIWHSGRQRSTATSTTEAEYMAVSEGVHEILWMQQFLEEITLKPSGPIELSCYATIKVALR